MDFSGHMLDLEEDDDLEVFTKVKIKNQKRSAAGSGTWLQICNL